MKQGLSLSRTTCEITLVAIGFNSARVSPKCLPTLDLNRIKHWQSTAHPVSAIPLKPAPLIRINLCI